MATGLLYYDGFEDTTVETDYWANVILPGTNWVIGSYARSGDRGLRTFWASGPANTWGSILHGATTAVRFGFAVKPVTWGTADVVLFRALEGTTLHVDLRINVVSKTFYFTRNGTVIASGSTALAFNAWAYVEGYIVIHDTTGQVALRLNGTGSDIAATSLDTRNGGTGVINACQLGLGEGASSRDYYYDDFYLLDATVSGAAWLGDVRVDSYLPAGAGDDADFTGSPGLNHENVDETDPDGDTSYNESATVGAKDTFALPNTPGGGATIYGVAHVMRARKTDAGTRELRGLLKSAGGTTANQTTRSLSNSYLSYFEHNENVPGGTGWAESDVDGLKVGYEVVT